MFRGLRSRFVLSTFLLGGCTAQVPIAPLEPTHPASPQAAEAPIAEPSATLRNDADLRGADATGGSMPASGHHGMTMPHHMGDMGEGTGQAEGSGGAVYTCPMHPGITASKPGKCPQCGMTLVKKPAPKADTGGMPGMRGMQ